MSHLVVRVIKPRSVALGSIGRSISQWHLPRSPKTKFYSFSRAALGHWIFSSYSVEAHEIIPSQLLFKFICFFNPEINFCHFAPIFISSICLTEFIFVTFISHEYISDFYFQFVFVILKALRPADLFTGTFSKISLETSVQAASRHVIRKWWRNDGNTSLNAGFQNMRVHKGQTSTGCTTHYPIYKVKRPQAQLMDD